MLEGEDEPNTKAFEILHARNFLTFMKFLLYVIEWKDDASINKKNPIKKMEDDNNQFHLFNGTLRLFESRILSKQ